MARSKPSTRVETTPAKVEVVEPEVLQAPPAPTAVPETHVASEGELLKLQAEVADVVSYVESLSEKAESLVVQIEGATDKEQETAQRHLNAIIKSLDEVTGKLEYNSKRFGFIRAAYEKAANRVKALKAKAAKAAEKAAADKAKANAKAAAK